MECALNFLNSHLEIFFLLERFRLLFWYRKNGAITVALHNIFANKKQAAIHQKTG